MKFVHSYKFVLIIICILLKCLSEEDEVNEDTQTIECNLWVGGDMSRHENQASREFMAGHLK